jgi:hypothetical protein
MYILYGRKKVHFWLNIHVYSTRILENIHVYLNKGLRYVADDQDCGQIAVGILIVGPLGFYCSFPAKIWAVRILLLK